MVNLKNSSRDRGDFQDHAKKNLFKVKSGSRLSLTTDNFSSTMDNSSKTNQMKTLTLNLPDTVTMQVSLTVFQYSAHFLKKYSE